MSWKKQFLVLVTVCFGYPGVCQFSPNDWRSWKKWFLVLVTGYFGYPGVFQFSVDLWMFGSLTKKIPGPSDLMFWLTWCESVLTGFWIFGFLVKSDSWSLWLDVLATLFCVNSYQMFKFFDVLKHWFLVLVTGFFCYPNVCQFSMDNWMFRYIKTDPSN